jgi:polysaccharide export outer membrane protein
MRNTKNNSLVFVIGVLAALVLSSCANSGSVRESPFRVPSTSLELQTDRMQSADSARIEIGDSISFSVWSFPEFTTKTYVRLNGTIMVPLVGEIYAVGLTKDEFVRVLKRKLSQYIQDDIKLAVEISKPVPRITVLGTVSRQGSFPSNNEISLLEALSIAGGWSENSDLRYIKISRQTSIADSNDIEVDLTHYIETGNVSNIPQVKPGDVIFVPKQENFIRELGGLLSDAFLLFGFFRLFN